MQAALRRLHPRRSFILVNKIGCDPGALATELDGVFKTVAESAIAE
ncbi:Hypothetical protein RAK1035_0913 [Roseovarius sp. AK1035]|jgi:hypothetical protein|nr:Hypothetical protein RAK1035_0913 [Roseovarius sp. AK1035]